MLSNALGDPVSGLTGTVALLSALAARERDGRGRLVEAAQLEGFLPLVSEALIEYQRTGAIPSRNGNRRAGHVPSGAFPCRGGEWVAIEVNSDAEWAGLASLIGEPWAMAQTFATQSARELREAEIEGHIAAWTQGRNRDEIVEACLAVGVVGSPVLTEGEILSLEPLVEAGFWEGEERAYVGFHLYPGLPIRGEGGRPAASGPAPTLGEHTAEVLAAMGLGGGELEQLVEEDVIGSRPG
jgi:crotonobetainyl-CoA:carnitine CoA-transferase CaiB-like acyl-CoA transferase